MGRQIYGETNGKLMEFSLCHLISNGTGSGEGGHPNKRNLCSVFRQRGGGQRAFLIFASSQLPSTQINPCAKATPFGVAY